VFASSPFKKIIFVTVTFYSVVSLHNYPSKNFKTNQS